MTNRFPWYDSTWLSTYVNAKNYVFEHYPERLTEFVDAFTPLRTRPDFKVRHFPGILDEKILQEARKIIQEIHETELEKQEIFEFGRMVVHNHPYFNALLNNLVDLVTEAAGEPVEHDYNFLSMYNNLGVCAVHLDAPYAKYTLDICIEQSHPWPIYLSETVPWPEDFKYMNADWERRIKSDLRHTFTGYTLNPGAAILFSGSSQWHYRERIPQITKRNFCHLIFYHFIPASMRDLVKPSAWAGYFGIPELTQFVNELAIKEPYKYSLADVLRGPQVPQIWTNDKSD